MELALSACESCRLCLGFAQVDGVGCLDPLAYLPHLVECPAYHLAGRLEQNARGLLRLQGKRLKLVETRQAKQRVATAKSVINKGERPVAS